MKKLTLLLTALAFVVSASAFDNTSIWTEVNNNVPVKGERKLFPTTYKVFALNDAYLKNQLINTPALPGYTLINLPDPNGSSAIWKVWQTPVMAQELAIKYPAIKTFTATLESNPGITAKLSYTNRGFSAMIYNGNNTYLIDPYTNTNEGYYICYYKKDFPATSGRGFTCGVTDDLHNDLGTGIEMPLSGSGLPQLAFKTHGTLQRTYRLALTCTGEYAVAVAGTNPTKNAVLGAISATLNRVNGILEKEMTVTLQLVANNDTLIFLDPVTDSFTTFENDIISPNTQAKNQLTVDKLIGSGNYDIGHVFCTANSGLADLAGLCDPGHEAKAATGSANPVGDPFDVNYVIHEIGHQLGAEHTFNSSGTGCGSHARPACAYEPGSGSTIMGYAGLCPGNDMQNYSDDYFHAKSLDQMAAYISTTDISTCGMTTASTNVPPAVADIRATYNIPYRTPFELQAPLATDVDNDAITYCWELYDLGDFGKGLNATLFGPTIRSFLPDTSRWRIFPTLDSILNGTNSYLHEKMPEATRELNFRLTVRDILNGWGTHNWSDTTVTLYATDQAGPFVVTSPNTYNDYWRNGNSYTVKWNVANTNNAPVNCSGVDILLSLDNGKTWPITLAANTPNDGVEMITVPPNSTTYGARVKIKGSGNVFFDISNEAFRINDWPDSINDILPENEVRIYPVPAKDVITVQISVTETRNVKMFNSIGQEVWSGNISGKQSVNTAAFARGIYYIELSSTSGNRTVRKVSLQ